MDYERIKDELAQYTETYHDSMTFDIEGYHEAYDECFLEDLINQVNAARTLLKAHEQLKFLFA